MQVITKNELLLKKDLLLSGLIGSGIYVLLFIGAGFAPLGSSTSSSQTTQILEPSQSIIFIIMTVIAIYHLCMIIFGLTLYVQFSEKFVTKMKITGLLFILLGLIGLMTLLFPTATQFDFSISSILAVLQWLTTIAVLLSSGLGLSEIYNMSGFIILSIIVLAIVILTLAIGIFLIWVGFISYILYKRESED